MLFHNNAKTFQNVSAESGPVFARLVSARGMAVGDFNNDRKLDIAVANNGTDSLNILLQTC